MPTPRRRFPLKPALALGAVLAAGSAAPAAEPPRPEPPASPPAAAPAPPPRPTLDELRARLPENAEAFRRTELAEPVPAPGEPDGLIARYRSRRTEAAVFLYSFPGADVPDGTASAALDGELNLDADGLREQLRRGGGALTEGEASVVLGGTPLLRCRTFRRAEGALVRSDWLCLGGAAGRNLKLHVLARHAPAAADEMARAVSRFAVALVGAVRGNGGPPRG